MNNSTTQAKDLTALGNAIDTAMNCEHKRQNYNNAEIIAPLVFIHECELHKMRQKTHFREYEQRLINFCFDHYVTKKLTKHQLC